jgi:diguanylate cyclase (GGDEF)-like protein
MHSMLLSAERVGKNGGVSAREEYERQRSAARGALERLKEHHGRPASSRGDGGARLLWEHDERLEAAAVRFTLLEKALVPVVLGESTTPKRSLNEAKMLFDGLFHDYYVKLHESHELRIRGMRDSAHQVKAATDVYFAAQLLLALVAGAAVLLYLDKVVLKMHAATERYALTDALTSLYNRRYAEKYLSGEIERSGRYQRSFALALIDVDDFKAFNDTYGHPAGDKLLKDLASLMQGAVRKTDTTARYGGEEFLIVFPELDKSRAVKVADKIRATVAQHAFFLPHSEPASPISISIGLAVFPEDGTTADALVKKADVLLYRAKKEGKNRVLA